MPKAAETVTVLLVEDDPHTRAHLARAVEAHPRLRLLGAAGSCADAHALLRSEPPEVLLTDLGLPDGSGIDLIRVLRQVRSDALALVVTVFGDESHVIASLEAGAHGYLLKDGSQEEIGVALDELLDGGSPISAPIARYLLKRFHDTADPPRQAEAPRLTTRETEVLELIVKGFSYGEIARLLEISSHTVTTHVRHIYEKLRVRSRGEAVYEAFSLGLVRMDR